MVLDNKEVDKESLVDDGSERFEVTVENVETRGKICSLKPR